MEDVNSHENVPTDNSVAYANLRGEPVTVGHTAIVNRMIADHKTVIIGIGSAQRSGEDRYPFTWEQRMQMWKNVYGDRCKYIPIVDLGTCEPIRWSGYNIEKITKIGMPEPTDYYGGLENASWFRFHFHMEGMDKTPDHYNSNGVLRRIHIMTRDIPISGTEVRTSIELGLDGWRSWVPAVNHDFIMENYPKHLFVPK